MRSSRRLRIMACIAVLTGILLISSFMSWLLFPYLEMRHTVHVMGGRKYDTLIVGTSHGKAGIDPDALYESCGLTAVNACLGNERMVDSYYLIRYAWQKAELKTVILEIDPAYWILPLQINPDSLRVYHEIPPGALKIAYAFDKLANEDYRSVFFEWYLYRNEILNAGRLWRDKHSEEYRNYDISRFDTDIQTYRENGFMAIKRPDAPVPKTDELITFKRENVQEDALEMLERIVDFCAERDISLIAVTTPVPETTYEAAKADFEDAGVFMSGIAKEYGLTYFDYTSDHRDGISRDPDDYNDNDGHMYADTAAEFTRVFAGDLKPLI